MSDKPPNCPCCGSQDVAEYITESWIGDDEWWCQSCDVRGPKAAFARRTPPPATARLLSTIRGRDAWGRDVSYDPAILGPLFDALEAEWPDAGTQTPRRDGRGG